MSAVYLVTRRWRFETADLCDPGEPGGIKSTVARDYWTNQWIIRKLGFARTAVGNRTPEQFPFQSGG